MDWISFFWGVGAIIFVNIVYTLLILPKQLKQIGEQNGYALATAEITDELKHIVELENRVSNFESFYEEKMASINKERDELVLAVEILESSIKLRKMCPVCNHEFPLYFVEEK